MMRSKPFYFLQRVIKMYEIIGHMATRTSIAHCDNKISDNNNSYKDPEYSKDHGFQKTSFGHINALLCFQMAGTHNIAWDKSCRKSEE